MVPCSKCGHNNELGHIFCAKCSAKLDFNAVSEQQLAAPARAAGFLKKVFVEVVMALVIVAAGLALWPASLDVDRGETADAQSAHKKIGLLRQGGGRQKGHVIFSEAEVNAYLKYILSELKKNPGKGRELANVKSMELDVKPDGIVFQAVRDMSGLEIGSFKPDFGMTYQVVGVLELTEEGMAFQLRRGAIGHLPLPGPAGQLVMTKIRPLFQLSEHDRSFLDKLGGIELGDAEIMVTPK
ncbi:MAG: hypothetical protein HY343_04730 [Lentisphaerae bacterium]|nr:hypothetical protein [Lentisphaerota bacterium]